MDIIGAMNKEREYLSFRAKGEEPYHLVDAVKEYGFESLNEYFEAKRDFEFTHQKFELIETTPEKMVANIFDIIEKKRTSFLFTITDKTLVWNGNNGAYNAEYCNECGIPIYSFYTGGGTIVSTPGDFNFGICVPLDTNVNCDYILNRISKIFKKYTNKQVEVSGNDIIVGGLKVLGSAFYKNNKMFMFVASVSMSNKNDLICNICYKHSTKQPGYIDFMTAEQLRGEIEKWLKVSS